MAALVNCVVQGGSNSELICDIQQKANDTFFFQAQFLFLDNFWKLIYSF